MRAAWRVERLLGRGYSHDAGTDWPPSVRDCGDRIAIAAFGQEVIRATTALAANAVAPFRAGCKTASSLPSGATCTPRARGTGRSPTCTATPAENSPRRSLVGCRDTTTKRRRPCSWRRARRTSQRRGSRTAMSRSDRATTFRGRSPAFEWRTGFAPCTRQPVGRLLTATTRTRRTRSPHPTGLHRRRRRSPRLPPAHLASPPRRLRRRAAAAASSRPRTPPSR